MSVLYFIVMVAVLVFVHELGHFACAKVFRVRVLRVSLGFGPRLFGFVRGETEYVVSALPFGGYVRMLGENPLDEVRPEDADRSFVGQSLFRRIVIVVAGPIMNLAFPVLLYFVVFLGDGELSPASLGVVFPDLPAAEVLQPGDKVLEVDGDTIETFYELSREIEGSAGNSLELTVLRGDETLEVEVTPVLASAEHPLDEHRSVGRIGVMPQHPKAVIGVPDALGPAAEARLRTFDRIVSVSGRPVKRFIDLEALLDRNRGTLIPVTYLRPTPLVEPLGGLMQMDVYQAGVTALTPDAGRGQGLQRAGLELADLYIAHVAVGSPEQGLGLRAGDRLLALDGKPLSLWHSLIQKLRAAKGKTHTLTWLRGGETMSGTFRLRHQGGVTEHGQVLDRHVVGMRNWAPARTDPPVPNPSPILYAMREAWTATAEVVELTVLSLVRLVEGRLTLKSIGGPLTIFEVAGSAAREGTLNYLTLMAFISINLGLINLFPIPLLDGGHMAIFLIEAVMRRPLSVQVREYAHIAGFVVLAFIMMLAIKNDLERQWPEIVNIQTSE